MLIIVTLCALVAAAGLGALAWSLARQERRRSDARVAALIASLGDSALDPGSLGDSGAADVVIAGSSPDDRQNGALILEAPFREDAPTAPIQPLGPALGVASGPTRAGLFADATRDEDAGSNRLKAVGVLAAVFVGAIAASWLAARAFTPEAPAPTAAVRAADHRPLELLSLTSTRRGQDLSIAGLVRNPRTGAPIGRVAAIIFFFDEHGAFLTSARAPLELTTLAPGDECPFQVTVAAVDGISRYRVSFRVDEGGVVPHVDRRMTGSGGRGPLEGSPVRRAGL